MRSLFLLACFSLSMFAQGPQKGCAKPLMNEEDSCCCTTYDTNICLSKVATKVDQELNTVYQDALERWKEDPENVELRDAERLDCLPRRDLQGGSRHLSGGTIMPALECDVFCASHDGGSLILKMRICSTAEKQSGIGDSPGLAVKTVVPPTVSC